MCGAPTEPDIALPGKGLAPSPPLLAFAGHSWQHYVAGAPTSVGTDPRRRDPAERGGSPQAHPVAPLLGTRWAENGRSSHVFGASSRPSKAVCTQIALPLWHYTPRLLRLGTSFFRARNARVLSFARAYSSPYTPRGTALEFGPLALRSCLGCTACQNRLARTAVANPRQIRSSPPNRRISCRRPDSADSPHRLCPHRARPRAPGPGHAVAGRPPSGGPVRSFRKERRKLHQNFLHQGL